MTTPEIHDGTIERLAARLGDLLRPAGEYVVQTHVACQLLNEFPTALSMFDVAVIGASPCWLTGVGGRSVLSPADAPVLAVNVVTGDTLEADTLRIPNTLARTAVHEYVTFDPTATVLRPAFQAFVISDGELIRLWPAFHGVFFSSLDIRLDVRVTDLVATACGRGRVEEELFVLRWERDKLDPTDSSGRDKLDAQIARLMMPRTPRGGTGE
ncbi:MAG: hypothetical protein JWO38_7714 [Gemmataceae bacterium]|nr:hypothetical protein [Gemmataceae bacterium]